MVSMLRKTLICPTARSAWLRSCLMTNLLSLAVILSTTFTLPALKTGLASNLNAHCAARISQSRYLLCYKARMSSHNMSKVKNMVRIIRQL